jgi:hypothetical protein
MDYRSSIPMWHNMQKKWEKIKMRRWKMETSSELEINKYAMRVG